MYSVLIVEDEKLVRIGLKNSIQWQKFEMNVIADVPDGEAALAVYEREKPDIVITDIRMPIMGGMELIAKIRENDKDTKIIILTCLEEFDLVRKALNFDVSGYILKLTMTDDEIENVLGKIKEELKETQNAHYVDLTLKNGGSLIKDKIITDFIQYQMYSIDEFTRKIRELKLRIKPNNLILTMMEIDFQKLKDFFIDEHGQLVKFSILNVINEIMDGYGNGEIFYYNDTRYLLIFNVEEFFHDTRIYGDIFSILDKIRRSMEKFFNISVSFGVSSTKVGYGALKSMFEQASKALESKFFNGTGIYFHQHAINSVDVLKGKAAVLYTLLDEFGPIDGSLEKKYKLKIDNILDSISDSKKQVQQLFCDLLQWLAAFFNIGDAASVNLILSGSKSIQVCGTFDEIIICMREFFSEMKVLVKRKKRLSREISLAVEYLEMNYSKDISLQKVAAHVNISSGYFSILFKKELEVNFIDYLNELRIEKAKGLILGSCLKSYEIAEKIGFNDDTYFSKTFKHYTGMKPSEFRKQWGKK